MPASPPLRLVLGLALAILLDTAAQLLWKSGISALPDSSDLLVLIQAALAHPILLAVLALMLVQFANWMIVLNHADLSFAHAVTSLSYATVALASAFWLEEHIGLLQGLGISLIVAGVWRVCLSGHNTTAQRPQP